jgi:hypothetical protein
MQILTKEALSDKLSSELAWRKKELSALKKLVGTNSGDVDVYLRSSICLLYAHFEGFTKQATVAYLEFLSNQGLQCWSLSKGLLGSYLYQKYGKGIFASNNINEFEKFILLCRSDQNHKIHFKADELFSAKSNLTYDRLKNIFERLGLDPSFFETKQKLIDTKLLGRRNNVAHGESVPVDKEDFDELHIAAIEIMEQIKTQIENSVVLESYLLNDKVDK